MTIKRKSVAIWSIVASMLFLSSALPNAYGLEFPMTSTVEIQGDATALASAATPIDSAAALYGSISLASTSVGAVFSSDLALVSSISASVEMARTPEGAKEVAEIILSQEYGFSQSQFECLDSLWTRESHWNYKAHKPRQNSMAVNMR